MRSQFAPGRVAIVILACAALVVVACGGKKESAMPGPPPEGAGVADIMRHYLPHQRAEVERYCGCKDDACRDSATTRLRALNQSTIDAIEKIDFDPKAPMPEDLMSTMKSLSDRVAECGIPREKLAIEPKGKLGKVAREREKEYAASARKAGEAAAPEPDEDVWIRLKDSASCAGALPMGNATCRAVAGETVNEGGAMPDYASAKHCFASLDQACSCSCGSPSTFADDCSGLSSVSTAATESSSDEGTKTIVVCEK